MNGASLQRSAVLSFLFHITLFGITLWAARQANHFVMPSPYVVTIVGPESVVKVQESPRAESVAPQKAKTENRVSPASSRVIEKSKEEDVSDAINALKAKREIEKRVKLRDIVSVKVGKGEGRSLPSIQQGKSGRGSSVQDYTARIVNEIHDHYDAPPGLFREDGLETIVAIRIQKNGSVQVMGIEKSSGNPLFDRSALRAITKASPVTAPPQEMEIGVRFYP